VADTWRIEMKRAFTGLQRLRAAVLLGPISGDEYIMCHNRRPVKIMCDLWGATYKKFIGVHGQTRAAE